MVPSSMCLARARSRPQPVHGSVELRRPARLLSPQETRADQGPDRGRIHVSINRLVHEPQQLAESPRGRSVKTEMSAEGCPSAARVMDLPIAGGGKNTEPASAAASNSQRRYSARREGCERQKDDVDKGGIRTHEDCSTRKCSSVHLNLAP
jgi:hypothetical protein